MNRPLKKLTKGILLLSTFSLYDNYMGVDGLHKMVKAIQTSLSFLQKDLASMIASLVGVIISVTMVYCFISGLFRIITFNQHIPTYEK